MNKVAFPKKSDRSYIRYVGSLAFIFYHVMSKPTTKVWLLFLSKVLAVFDKFNAFFQRSLVLTAHKLHGESTHLLRTF